MSDAMMTALARLLETSLAMWQVAGSVRAERSEIIVSASAADMIISRAPDTMPFRWIVVTDGRRRTAASVNGVVRILRQAVMTEYEPLKLRVAPLPPAPPQAGP